MTDATPDPHVLGTAFDEEALNGDSFMANRMAMEEKLGVLREVNEALREGGGDERQHAKGRLTARERLDDLLDPDAPFLEIGLHAGWGMYDEWGIPSANVVTGVGSVSGRRFMVIANDATIKAGAFVPMTAKKVLRAQRIAMENHLPLIYLVDSAGVFLPLQDEVFPDKDDFGKVFDYNARISALGIPQISAILGQCVAGGAYLPVICDHLIMTEGSGLYLAAAELAKAARLAGPDITNEEIGGAGVHAQISGTIDHRCGTDQEALAMIRDIASRMGPPAPSPFDRSDTVAPLYDPEELLGIMPADERQPYDSREILARILDGSVLHEVKPEFGRTLICGWGRIGGYSVGIVANQADTIRRDDAPWETGRVLYPESAIKGARFVMECNQMRIPLVFIHDVNGFIVGTDAEHAGIIRHGAKMVNAVANSVVPKISIIVGGSFGAGHYAMCGRAYRPRYIAAWPTARYSVMGGGQAAGVLVGLREAQIRRDGGEVTEGQHEALLEEIHERYAEQMDPVYGAARLWLDAVIPPQRTRDVIVQALEMAAHNPEIPPFRTGNLQV